MKFLFLKYCFLCVISGLSAAVLIFPILSRADTGRGAQTSTSIHTLGKAYENLYENTQKLGLRPSISDRKQVRSQSFAAYYETKTRENKKIVEKYHEASKKIRADLASRSEAVQKMKKNPGKKEKPLAEKKSVDEKSYIEDVVGGQMISIEQSRSPGSVSSARVGSGDVGETSGAENVDFNAPSAREEPNFQ